LPKTKLFFNFSDFPDHYQDMMSVADAGAKAIVHSTNGIYSYGSTY